LEKDLFEVKRKSKKQKDELIRSEQEKMFFQQQYHKTKNMYRTGLGTIGAEVNTLDLLEQSRLYQQSRPEPNLFALSPMTNS
jgi:hypothetical protein